jgi:hypothetical protein
LREVRRKRCRGAATLYLDQIEERKSWLRY